MRNYHCISIRMRKIIMKESTTLMTSNASKDAEQLELVRTQKRTVTLEKFPASFGVIHTLTHDVTASSKK